MQHLGIVGREISVGGANRDSNAETVSGVNASTRFRLWLHGAVEVPPDLFEWAAPLDRTGIELVVGLWCWGLSRRISKTIELNLEPKLQIREVNGCWETTAKWEAPDHFEVSVNLNGYWSVDEAIAMSSLIIHRQIAAFRPTPSDVLRTRVHHIIPFQPESVPGWALNLRVDPYS